MQTTTSLAGIGIVSPVPTARLFSSFGSLDFDASTFPSRSPWVREEVELDLDPLLRAVASGIAAKLRKWVTDLR